MAPEQAPAYQWYVKDWRSSRATQRMSFSERGVYREMLDQQWEDVTLPDDPQAVADLIATTDAQAAEVIAAWPAVRRKFVLIEGMPGRIENTRLSLIRQDRRRFERWSKKNAVKGGQARATGASRTPAGMFNASSQESSGIQPDSAGVVQPGVQRSPAESPAASSQASSGNQPGVQRSPASSSSSSSSSSPAVVPLPAGRSKRPIFSGQRFTVFEWQLDDLARLLGASLDAFDVHAFFFDLDARVAKSDDVIPQRDGGQWLAAQVLTEAKRRGLSVATLSKSRPGDDVKSNVPTAEQTRAKYFAGGQ